MPIQTNPFQLSLDFINFQSHPKNKKRSLFSLLNRFFGWSFYPLGILKILNDALGFVGPILLNLLVEFVSDPNEPIWKGYLYAFAMFLIVFSQTFLSSQFNYKVGKVSIQVRSIIISTIYEKSLSINPSFRIKFTTGEVINFMSTDADRIVNFCNSFHQFWSMPIQIGICLYLLYLQVDLAFLAGLAFAILLIPINRAISNKIAVVSKEMMAQKDSRVKITNEVLYGIRLVKFLSWETSFIKRIESIRNAELKNLAIRKYLDALCVFFWATTPVLISILTFGTYALVLQQPLTPAKVFTSLALFNMLITPLNSFPWVINGIIEAAVSLNRVEKFLSSDNLVISAKKLSPYEIETTAVYLTEASFSWQNSLSKLQLERFNFRMKINDLVMVVGMVGSGKSSLLAAIAQECPKVAGEMFLNHHLSIAYVPQEPWIQNATFKENILFHKTFDNALYQQVLFACALLEDLKTLPAGDETEIGENGINLSGGQKARLSLARALYQDRDFYLIDDPFSAVDAHVGKHILEHCILGFLKQRGKTIMLTTNHTQYLTSADNIILIEEGLFIKSGTYPQILPLLEPKERETKAKKELFFNDNSLINLDFSTPEITKENPERKRKRRKKKGKIRASSIFSDENSSELSISQSSPLLSKSSPTGIQDVQKNQIKEIKECKQEKGTSSKLTSEEERHTGYLTWEVYKAYFAAIGTFLVYLVFISLFLMQASRNVSDWWLTFWVQHSDYYDTQFRYYLTIYGIIGACNSAFTLVRAFSFAYAGLKAGRQFHFKLLHSILNTTFEFFDTTPVGRIVNRFSSDQYAIDDSLPFIANILLANLIGLLGTLVVICYSTPLASLTYIPLGIIYYIVQRYYRQTSRELKRLDSISRSPIYAHFSESINGVSTIRSFQQQNIFSGENLNRLHINICASYNGLAASQWLGVRLQLLSVGVVSSVALFAVIQHHIHSVDPGLVGLAIAYALPITNTLSGLITSFSETEKEMISVERATQYFKLPEEKSYYPPYQPPEELPQNWPVNPSIIFFQFSLAYRSGLPPSLKNINCSIRSGEKIGICGRTGSGKSSFIQALFRTVPLTKGQIFIDGVNIFHLPLRFLRSKLSIISQQPVIFSGSLRDNLDPFHEYSDDILWSALEKCCLKENVKNLKDGLNYEVAEHGENFSVGQKQLLCLARALLRKSQILCIDEATASVDNETDSLMQQTIRSEFKHCTVFTVAHRIHTILDSDRIIVMEGGEIKEFDTPSTLLSRKNSLFSSLIAEFQNTFSSK